MQISPMHCTRERIRAGWSRKELAVRVLAKPSFSLKRAMYLETKYGGDVVECACPACKPRMKEMCLNVRVLGYEPRMKEMCLNVLVLGYEPRMKQMCLNVRVLGYEPRMKEMCLNVLVLWTSTRTKLRTTYEGDV